MSREAFKSCVNETDLIGDIKFEKLYKENTPFYRDPKNICFSKNDILNLLKSTKVPKHPYTGEYLWEDVKSFEKYLQAVADTGTLTPREVDNIVELYYPSTVTKEAADILAKYPGLIDEIGLAGCMGQSNYDKKYDTRRDLDAAAKSQVYGKMISIEDKEDKNLFYNLKSTLKQRIDLDDILSPGSEKGAYVKDLLPIYLTYRNRKKKLIKPLIQTKVRDIILFPYMKGEDIYIILYRYPSSGNKEIYAKYCYYDSKEKEWKADEDFEDTLKEIPRDLLAIVDDDIENIKGLKERIKALEDYQKKAVSDTVNVIALLSKDSIEEVVKFKAYRINTIFDVSSTAWKHSDSLRKYSAKKAMIGSTQVSFDDTVLWALKRIGRNFVKDEEMRITFMY